MNAQVEMIILKKKRRGINIAQVFFCESVLPDLKGFDILQVVQAKSRFSGCFSFGTQLIDLAGDEDQILAGFNKAAQYDVRRMSRENGVVASVLDAEDSNLRKFSEFYNSFARLKNIKSISLDWLKELSSRGDIILAVCEGQGYLDFLCVHAYLVDGRRARLLYSATNVGLISSGGGQFVARSNRYLHWKMIQYFKNQCFSHYDLGGIAGSVALRGIDEFKQSLGGAYIEEFNGLVPASVKGRIALLFLKAFDIYTRCVQRGRIFGGGAQNSRVLVNSGRD